MISNKTAEIEKWDVEDAVPYMVCETHKATWIDNRFTANETGEQCSPLQVWF